MTVRGGLDSQHIQTNVLGGNRNFMMTLTSQLFCDVVIERVVIE